MKLILLSGGSGKRLWPLSNEIRSKQFLKVIKDTDQVLESMVQRVWHQLKSVGLSEFTFIATGKEQVDILQNQLGNQVPLIVEPRRRDTFPAISLACSYLFSVKKVDLDEIICVLPVDPYVGVDFFEKVKQLPNIVNKSMAELALIGVQPTYPSENYGYIVPKSKLSPDEKYHIVNHFIEKPKYNKAKKLIKKHALWNCGVFAFKLGYLLTLLLERGYPTRFEELEEQYELLPKKSFDYEVVEKANKIVVTPYFGEWKDLGTWNTLTEEMDSKIVGKGIICEQSKNTHLINELDIPVVIQGLSDVVVAVSPDGVLVTDKSTSNKTKELVEEFIQRPMYEERRWGWYRVLDYTKLGEEREVLTKRIGITRGKNLSYQFHQKRSEVWTIISGEGDFVLNDKIYQVKQGDVLQIPVGAKHGIKANTYLEFIEVQTGSKLIEDDIVRIFMSWEEVERHCSEK